MKGSFLLRFFSQHRTPVLPQVPAEPQLIINHKVIRVGYLLSRNQVVKHDQHPIETEFAYTLEREHLRYCRHDGSESATHFLASRGQAMDALGRTEASQIESNFYGLELYQDAMRVVLQRYQPEKRVTAADLRDPFADSLKEGPPPRTTLNRALDDFLYLIIKHKDTGKWSIPTTRRKENESLRMSADRCLGVNGDTFDAYVWSNAPQGVLKGTAPASSGANEELTFVFNATYLSGKPNFEGMGASDHAWVRRCELPQYDIASVGGYESPQMLGLLMDISLDSTFDGSGSSL